ncbi:PPOX class F420-dependent oxidoreductase [Cryobacterium algoritolerans]|uniref:PPOX class F420-dependent oxidoreductase n=1 Tax=Cryobacterium algoritolerans TaxID=1259184 RepID=A0A4R8X005_9MICO|nr:PPOX class F420-dependent oxidoreductase [Cryobacterium algoritolerans]TFC19793.1 PPOX class F420-dependent oxidoreductase [Cryobacterium algoritolerans]
MLTDALLALGAEKFVLLTTFRKTGDPVKTPVWVAVDADRLLVTTASSSGKVKRLRHTARIELVACNARGVVTDAAVAVTAQAEVRADEATIAALETALLGKYGLAYRAIRGARRLSGSTTESVAIVITPA